MLSRFYSTIDDEEEDKLAQPEVSSETTPQVVEPLPYEAPTPQPVRPLPQGISPDQQSSIDSRLAGLSALQAGSLGIGQITNIFKPGLSDPSATMALYKQFQSQVQQPKAEADLARKRAMEDQQVADAQALRGEQTQAAHLKNTQYQAEHNPGSKESLSAADNFSQHYSGLAKSGAWKPELSAMFQQAADNAKGKSLAELTFIDNRLGKTIGQVNQADLAKGNQEYKNDTLAALQNRDRANADNIVTDNKLSREKFEYEKKHNADKLSLKVQGMQDSLKKELSDLDVGYATLKKVLEIKTGQTAEGKQATDSTGKKLEGVDTGPVVAPIMNKLNKYGIGSQDRVQMMQKLYTVFNREKKTMAGAALSPQEWVLLEPYLPMDRDDDPTFISKVKSLMENMATIRQSRAVWLKDPDLAQKLGYAPPPSLLLGSPSSSQNDELKQAQEWLSKNPKDPLAPQVREKLKKLQGK